MIDIKNLTKIFYNESKTSFTAIKDISCTIKKGEVICIVGSSGAGKSTILNCLTGLDNNYKGSIRINGQDSINYFKNNRIALVSQKYSNFEWLNIYENIAIGFGKGKYSKEEIQSKTNKLLKRMGLYKVKHSYPNTLSGGMQQRVAIARALAQETDIIALDEPFGALDVEIRSQMQEFLTKIQEEEKKTMILVTHDIDEAIYLADKILIIGGKPGTLKDTIKVNITKHRQSEIRFQENFLKIKKYISYMIRSESIKSNIEEGIITNSDSIKMGLYIRAGNAPLYYAKDNGLYMEQNLNIEQISFDSNQEKINLFLNKKLDLINVTLDKAIELHNKYPGIKILRILTKSIGGDGLITHKDINSVKDLKGKSIGLEKNSVAEFFLEYILNKYGLSKKDIKIKNMKCSKIGAQIISNKIDGGILREPWLDKAHKLSNMKILKTTKDFPILYDAMIIHQDTYKNKKEEMDKIIKTWNQTIKIFKKEEKEIINIASSHIGISQIELKTFLTKINFFSNTPNDINSIINDIENTLKKEQKIKNKENHKTIFIDKTI